LLAAPPQALSTSALIKVNAAAGTRPLIGASALARARTGPAVPVVAFARVLIKVILPVQWLKGRRRNWHPSQAAGFRQISVTRLVERLGPAGLMARPPDSSAAPMAPRAATSHRLRC
jgi:hypothetical protein